MTVASDGMENDGAPGSLEKVLQDIAIEREAQDRMWGAQEWPDGSGPELTEHAEEAKRECAAAWSRGELAWRHSDAEEFSDAAAASDPRAVRSEPGPTPAVAMTADDSA